MNQPPTQPDERVEPQLTLGELADRAGVTVRTVRYYIHNGLLPAPTTRGPKAGYTQGHLDRLLLIKRLQDQYLPLAEIRRALTDLDDDGVRRSLDERQAASAAEAPSSALEYIQSVLARQERADAGPAGRVVVRSRAARSPLPASNELSFGPEPPAEISPPSAQAPPAVPAPGDASLPSAPAPGAAVPPSAVQSSVPHGSHTHNIQRSQWDRIVLAPDVELHIRRPLSRRDKRAVDRLIDEAHRLFGEE